HLDVVFRGFREFGSRPGTGDDKIGLCRYRTCSFCAQRFGTRFGFLTCHLFEAAGEDDGHACDRRAFRLRRGHRLDGDFFQQAVEQLAIVRFLEEFVDRLGHNLSDAADMGELFHGILAPHRLDERVDIEEVAGQKPGVGFADVADAECIDETVKPDLAARVDGSDEVFDELALAFLFLLRLGDGFLAFLGAAFRALFGALFGQHLAELCGLFCKLEDVGRFFQHSGLMQRFDVGAAETFDVERIAADEMFEALHNLRRTDEAASAAAVDIFLAGLLVHLAHGVAAAYRAFVRHVIGFRAAWTFLRDHTHDLRDHIARALDDNRIAFARIETGDFVFIVKRGVFYHHAADRDGLQPRNRRHLARAAHLNVDLLQNRFGLFGREFVRDGPTWGARDETKAFLQIETIHLVDHAVDVVAELGALAFDVAIEFQHIVDRLAAFGQRVDLKTVGLELLQHVPLDPGG